MKAMLVAGLKTPFGKHDRVCFYQGVPDFRSIISLEASGDQIERLPNTRDEQGGTLVMGKDINLLLLTSCAELPSQSPLPTTFETTYERSYVATSIRV